MKKGQILNKNMKNILSYNGETSFSGQEIYDWASNQVTNNSSHKKKAAQIIRLYPNLKTNRYYRVYSNNWYGDSSNPDRPIIIKETSLA